MVQEKKTKAISYKCVGFTEAPATTLREQLASALKAAPKVGGRRESLAPENESPIWRLLGEYKVEEQFVYGVLIQYAPGTNPVFLIDDVEAETLTVEQLAAPETTDGKRRELVESTLYFGVIDNHLAILQSSLLRADHLEKHLQWFLHETKALPETISFKLNDQPPKAIREKIAATKVKALDLGGHLVPPPPEPKPDGTQAKATGQATKQVTKGLTAHGDIEKNEFGAGIIDAIKMLMEPDKAAKLNFDEMSDANLEYQLRITYRRSTTEDGQKLMNTLGSAFRHSPSVDAKIVLEGGSTVSGDDLRLTGNVRLTAYNGVFAPNEVYEAIRLWLLEKLKSGDIAVA